MMMAYEKFDAWKAAHELALAVYQITDRWPNSERYQLTAQIRRAALSVPTNISEGAAKRGPADFRRYVDIARGSLSELTYLLRFSGIVASLMMPHSSDLMIYEIVRDV